MHYTTIEQSKKLLELGLSPETADMHIVNQNYGDHGCFRVGLEYHAYGACLVDGYIPCWSVAALLEIVPGAVLGSITDNEGNRLWYCNTIQFGEEHFNYDGDYHDNQIDACFEAISWLLENNYIKKGE